MKFLPLLFLCSIVFLSCDDEEQELPLGQLLDMKLEDYEQISLTNMAVGQISIYDLPVNSESPPYTSPTYTFVVEVVEEVSDGFIINEYIGYENGVYFNGSEDFKMLDQFHKNEIAKYKLKIADDNFEIEPLEFNSMIFANNLKPNHQYIDSLNFNQNSCSSSGMTIDGETPFFRPHISVTYNGAGAINDQTINGINYSNCYMQYQESTYFSRGRYDYMITDQDGLILRAYHDFFNIEGTYKYCLSLIPNN